MLPAWIPAAIIGFPILFLTALLALSFALRRRRRLAMQALAARLGLSLQDSGLPPDLDLSTTYGLRRLLAARNVLTSTQARSSFLAFDCSFGFGRIPQRATVLAIPNRNGARFHGIALQQNWLAEAAGAWIVTHRPANRWGSTRLDTVAELEAELLSLR